GVSSHGRNAKMVEETLKLAYGEDSNLIKDKADCSSASSLRNWCMPTLCGLSKRGFCPDSQIYIPVPTWAK
ncbi:unnamed protein product, partial [Ilex paraguariensis]